MQRGVQCALVMGVVRWGGMDRFRLGDSFVGFSGENDVVEGWKELCRILNKLCCNLSLGIIRVVASSRFCIAVSLSFSRGLKME